MLTKDSYEYFIGCQDVETGVGKPDEDEIELIEALKSSYLLMPEGVFEKELVEEVNNEYLQKVANGKTLDLLDLRISEKCNFGCKHCISSKSKSGKVMTVKTAISAVDSFIRYLSVSGRDVSKLDIHYGNAEPLMNFSVIRQVQEYLRSQYSRIDVASSVNTNLSLLTAEMADFLVKEKVDIYVSLDGDKTANDLIRVFKNGKGTYDTILRKISLLKKFGKTLQGVSVTITEKNFKYFSLSFIDWCIENGFCSLAVDFDLVNAINIPLDEMVDFLSSAWEICQKRKIEFFGTWMAPFLNVSNNSVVDNHYAFCKGVHGRSISVSPDEQVYICGYSSTALGNIWDIGGMFSPGGGMYELISSRLIGRNKFCEGCIIEGACAGQCQSTNEYSQENKINLCDFYRAITEKLLTIQGASEMAS
jgi:uncharacterized protein